MLQKTRSHGVLGANTRAASSYTVVISRAVTASGSVTRGELGMSIAATAACLKSSVVQDPVGYSDLSSLPEPTKDVLVRRVTANATPREPSTYMWPKDHGGERTMTYLDPFDEIVYRALVGRFLA